jgi:6-phosphogluconolactonase
VTTYFYTASGATGDVDAYRVDPGGDSGTVSLERTASVNAGKNLGALAIGFGDSRLYVADRTQPAIVTFDVAPTGALTRLGAVPTLSPLANLCLSADRKNVYGVSYVDGTVCVHPLNPDGSVRPAETAPLHLGGDARCHDVVEVAPDEVIVSSLGHDVLYRVRRDPGSGTLGQAPSSVKDERGSGPRHLRLSPARDVLYVLGERSARITAHALTSGQAPRSWHTVPPGVALAPGIVRTPGSPAPAGDPASGLPYTWAADLALSPEGRLLFSSERSSSTVSVTSAATGELLAWTHVEQQQPRGIGLDPTGRFLMVTGELSESVSLYAVAEDGRLRHAASAPAHPGVLWAESASLDRIAG